jgi:hypothetical protein
MSASTGCGYAVALGYVRGMFSSAPLLQYGPHRQPPPPWELARVRNFLDRLQRIIVAVQWMSFAGPIATKRVLRAIVKATAI